MSVVTEVNHLGLKLKFKTLNAKPKTVNLPVVAPIETPEPPTKQTVNKKDAKPHFFELSDRLKQFLVSIEDSIFLISLHLELLKHILKLISGHRL